MQFNRIKLPLASAVTGSGSFSFGTPDPGYVGMASFTAAVGEGAIYTTYLVTWGSGSYEIGVGSMTPGGSVFNRDYVVENNLGSDQFQNISLPATFAVVPTVQNSVMGSYASGVAPKLLALDALAIGSSSEAAGQGAIALGMNAAAGGGFSLAVGGSASATGDNAVALGAYAQATGHGSVALGAGVTAVNSGELAYMEFPAISVNTLSGNTSGTTPLVLESPSSIPTVLRTGCLSHVKIRVIGTTYPSPTKILVREFEFLATELAVVNAKTPVQTFNIGTFSGTSAVTINASGEIVVTVTGIAATNVAWGATIETQSLDLNWF